MIVDFPSTLPRRTFFVFVVVIGVGRWCCSTICNYTAAGGEREEEKEKDNTASLLATSNYNYYYYSIYVATANLKGRKNQQGISLTNHVDKCKNINLAGENWRKMKICISLHDHRQHEITNANCK